MKKVLSVLLAVVLCLAFSTMAFAAEETAAANSEDLDALVNEIVDAAGEGDLEGIANAVQINGDKLYDAFGDIVEGADTIAANEAVDYVVTAISELTGADMENVRVIVLDAIEEYGLENVEIVSADAIPGLVDEICARLEEYGIDTAPILDKLGSSTVGGAIIGIYTGDVEEPTEEPEAPVDDEIPEEEPEIPVTGQASSIAAFAVLAVAAAGAYVCTRKKAE
ncbi:MAG: hypothetical protein IKL16_00475 [Clostridia bacterium]|nr:hypothetical protein [Clostridia bacterium]